MAARLRPGAAVDEPGPAVAPTPTAEPLRRALLGVSLGLLLLVGLSRANAAQPDLLPRGWAPGALLPVTLAPALVTGTLWGAYLLGALAVLLGMRWAPPALRGWWVAGGLGGLTLLTAPFGSADHISYLAYGRILATGGDPYVESPVGWAGGLDPVTRRVEAPWTEEPSVYGPFGTLLHGVSAALGGESLRQGVWVWQLVVVLAWLLTRAALRTALPRAAHGRIDVAWTLNPLVLGVGVLGAHIDLVAGALVVTAVAMAGRWTGLRGAALAGAVLGLAMSTKVTYGVGALALAGGWWLVSGRTGAPRRIAAMALGALVLILPLHLWAGPHVLDQLSRSRQSVSLATPWRLVLEAARPALGEGATRTVITLGAAVLALALAAVLLRASRPAVGTLAGTALWVAGALQLAYSLAAPYSLPWYDVLVWAALPAVVAGPLDLVALGRLLLAALAYVPGRVLGMTPAVESVTLGFRRSVAPWLVLALWVAVLSRVRRRESGW